MTCQRSGKGNTARSRECVQAREHEMRWGGARFALWTYLHFVCGGVWRPEGNLRCHALLQGPSKLFLWGTNPVLQNSSETGSQWPTHLPSIILSPSPTPETHYLRSLHWRPHMLQCGLCFWEPIPTTQKLLFNRNLRDFSFPEKILIKGWLPAGLGIKFWGYNE